MNYYAYSIYYIFCLMNVKWTQILTVPPHLLLQYFSSRSTSAGSKPHLLLSFHQQYVVAPCPCVCLRCECVFTSTHRNLEVKCPFSKATRSRQWGYMPSLIAWLALVQLLLYSGHTIWQKNIFICFPGGFHNGRYLFNKVNPCELQRLHWDGWGSGGAALLVFSDFD